MRGSDICSHGQVQHGGMWTAGPAPVFPAIALPQASGPRLAQPPCARITGAHGPGGSGVRSAQRAEGLLRALTLPGPTPPALCSRHCRSSGVSEGGAVRGALPADTWVDVGESCRSGTETWLEGFISPWGSRGKQLRPRIKQVKCEQT